MSIIPHRLGDPPKENFYSPDSKLPHPPKTNIPNPEPCVIMGKMYYRRNSHLQFQRPAPFFETPMGSK